MTTVLIQLDPEIVLYDDLEDFLTTDDLFVEYFNAFLALPTFPTPICYNKETRGFEVVTNAKQELARQIKSAIRSQKRSAKIYNVVKHHSFIDIPLFPIEDPKEMESEEINTMYNVTTLNPEQGIHWVKKQRLDAFLESEYYMEYRLGKLLSQSKITGDHGEFILMKIDDRVRPKKMKKKPEDELPKIDPKEQLMKEMYVSMGDTKTSETDAWYNFAQMSKDTATTYVSVSRPKSAEILRRPTSARPVSAYSTLDGYQRSESGMGGSVRSSVYSARGVYTSKHSLDDDDDVYSSKLFHTDAKPVTPRPSDSICVVAEDFTAKRRRPFSSTVYSYPKLESVEADVDNESGFGGDDGDSVGSKDKGQVEDVENEQDENVLNTRCSSQNSIVFKNIDDLGTAIVAAVMKRSVSSLTNQEEDEVISSPDIQSLFPIDVLKEYNVDMLEKVSFVEEPPLTEEDKEVKAVMEESKKEEEKKKEEESDVDSLLDSEDDYEESDTYFRTTKKKITNLLTRRGIEEFKKFLSGTAGEKHWKLWIDIDRTRLMDNDEQLQYYLVGLKEKYHKPGAPFELTNEQKMNLGLTEGASWRVEKLHFVQNKIAEPLILYWAPRFLLKQMLQVDPNNSSLYHNMQKLKATKENYPNPPTASLLPLRPKSCVPRMQPKDQTPAERPTSATTTDTSIPVTSPPVGLRRVYSPSAVKAIESKTRQEEKRKKLLTAKIDSSKSSSPKPKTSSRSSPNIPKQTSPTNRPDTARSDASSKHEVRSRPSSAGSVQSDAASKASDESEFFGGNRVETLFKALNYEKESGAFLRKYIENVENKNWMNNLNFWTNLQEYHQLFYADCLDIYIVTKKAKTIYSKYIVPGAFRHIGCSREISREIYKRLNPPFEELFDVAEEYCIEILYTAWVQMNEVELQTYQKVELITVPRHLETKNKYVHNLQKRGLIKQRILTPEDPMEGYQDPVYDETLIEKIPEELRDYSWEKLIQNRIELQHFNQFLNENYASMDLQCWMDIEAFRRMHGDEKKRDAKAKELKTKYLTKKYFFGPNSPAGKEGQDKVVAAGGGYGKLMDDRPPNPILLEAQKYVRERLEKKWLPLFLATPAFAERQKPKLGMDNVVDDVLVQKRKKSQAIYKFLDSSKWLSPTKEIITFRNALRNPVTALQFRRYVSIEGELLENDVLFWLEVQKFKELYHPHSDDQLIMTKINYILNCFIDSQIPPSIQIDIPSEMAEKIIERKYERSPYLFREAQFAVFRYLFQYWNKFCDFRENLASDEVLPKIERQRRHAKIRERREQKRLEEKAQKEAERRIAMGLPPAGEEDDTFHELFAHEPEGSVGEEEEVEGTTGKDKISWSYSSYMSALEKEDILNNTDETTFSSLMSDNASETKDVTDDAEKESVISKKSASQTSLNKKEVRSDHTQTENRKTARFAEPENKGKRKGKDGRKLSLAPLEEETPEEELPVKPPKKSVKMKSNSPQLLQKR